MRLVLAVACACAALGLAASAAGAVTVSFVRSYDPGYRGGGSWWQTLRVDAALGEANDVAVARDGAAVRVSDASAPIVAGPGCVPEGESAVVCAVQPGYIRTQVDVGDGDDRVEMLSDRELGLGLVGGPGDDVLVVLGDGPHTVDGGPGSDRLASGAGGGTLVGGPGADTALGGPGSDIFAEGTDDGAPDTLVGGGGEDTVQYGPRGVQLVTDLALGTPIFGAEPDELREIEHVDAASVSLLGTEGPDELRVPFQQAYQRLIGRGGDDVLHGGPGPDALVGGEGADTIRPGGGDDRVDAGPGDDTVDLARRPAQRRAAVICGAGVDTVLAPPPATDLRLDCETVVVGGLTLRPRERGRRIVLRVTGEDGPPCALQTVAGGARRTWRGARAVLPARGLWPWAVRVRARWACGHGGQPPAHFGGRWAAVTLSPAFASERAAG